MPRAALHIAFTLLILLNGMGYSLIQLHFYWDREVITALYCINKDKPELQCDGQCELGKRLAEAKNQKTEQGEEITLEELQLTFVFSTWSNPLSHFSKIPVNTLISSYSKSWNSLLDLGVFHPPQFS